MPTPPSQPAIQPPVQRRSRESMDRVLAAAEELLAERLFEEIPLTEILSRARVSVGSFYARFGSREGLISPLHDRYDERVRAITDRIFAPERWEGVPLASRVRLLVRYGLMAYRRNRGLLRALVLEWRVHPERITLEQRQWRDAFHRRVAAVLVGDGSEIRHPDPGAAARFAFLTFGATCRDLLLQADTPVPLPSEFGDDDRTLGAELARNVYAHLTGPSLPEHA